MKSLLLSASLIITVSAWAQMTVVPAAIPASAGPAKASEAAVYEKVTQERAAKIVAGLGIADANSADRVRGLIARQYQDLSRIHAERDRQSESIKKETGDAQITAIAALKSDVKAKITQLHAAYLAKLAVELTPEQVEKVKDGMTYGVVPLTYQGYLKKYPALTEPQKMQVLAYLVEARELAMDAGSSDGKHAVFGKFKGRINNYLVKQGYDLKTGQTRPESLGSPSDATKTK